MYVTISSAEYSQQKSLAASYMTAIKIHYYKLHF